jgi:hypothetical protein
MDMHKSYMEQTADRSEADTFSCAVTNANHFINHTRVPANRCAGYLSVDFYGGIYVH